MTPSAMNKALGIYPIEQTKKRIVHCIGNQGKPH